MTRQLVRVTDQGVAFGTAVARIAESLSPLGTIARIVAESTACAVTMKELDVAGRRIDATTEVTLTRLENRRKDAAASLYELRRQVGRSDLTAEALRQCIRNMRRALGRPGTTVGEAQVYAELIRDFGDDLLRHHSQQGDQVLTGIDLVLNGADTGRHRRGGRPGPATTPATGRAARLPDNAGAAGRAGHGEGPSRSGNRVPTENARAVDGDRPARQGKPRSGDSRARDTDNPTRVGKGRPQRGSAAVQDGQTRQGDVAAQGRAGRAQRQAHPRADQPPRDDAQDRRRHRRG
ncbi:hypothetical protein [Micromonospora sp. KC723]|uniref:hypothetical protein n=1 Tax=Micromonospora sp. KC723 TaxID=2530381 RepID=UPI00104BE9C7|nr:hypothetical protein [Micromonospora sp. KC723]TDB74756.1 hypothetical protein E1165_13680 [Micromonospora sp. KC723]